MIKILFSDFDGTLFLHVPYDHFPDGNLESIELFRKHGLHFVMTTGRALPEFEDLSKGFEAGDDFIGANGSYCRYDDGSQEIQYADGMIIAELFERAEEMFPLINLMCYIDDQQRLEYNNLKGTKNREDLDDFMKSIRENSCLINIATIITNHPEELDEIEKLYEDEYVGKLTFSSPTPVVVDFTAPGVNKGRAIERFCRHYGIRFEETAGIGDGRNDIAIFDAVSLKFAMNSGHQQLKDKADYCVDSVKQAIDMILALNREQAGC